MEQLSTQLVSDNAVIVFEDLKVTNMMKSASGTVESPGTNVAAKRGLNAAIAASCWGMLQRRTRDKAEATGRTIVAVPAAGTSRRCSQCGHTERRNRAGKNFCCVACGHEDDADINAANNILEAGLAFIRRQDTESETNNLRPRAMKRQPQPVLPIAA